MNVEEIPSDELVTMTELWHRSFNAAGCNPMCHCCKKFIKVGEKFKLSTVQEIPKKDFARGLGYDIGGSVMVQDNDKEIQSREVMLCGLCTPKAYFEHQQNQLNGAYNLAKTLLAKRKEEGGCFRINGKIVH